MNDEERVDHNMLMPFVTVTSKGGPHDDDSYVAGYEMGLLEALLEFATWPIVRTIRTDNVPQADLIAMRFGFAMESYVYEPAPEWTSCLFTPGGHQ